VMAIHVDYPADFPALFKTADSAAGRAQHSYLQLFKRRLGALLIAALGGAVTVAPFSSFDLGGGLAFIAFAWALGAQLYLASTSPLTSWYEARAVAESAKTLAWRYMVRGEPFESNERDVDARFLSSIFSLLQDLRYGPVVSGDAGDHQISEKMRRVRALPFPERRRLYLEQRIYDQQSWYSDKARWNDRRARGWVLLSIGLETTGVVSGALKAFGWIDVDLLGLLAAAAGAATAWLEAKQHRNLATAYGIASQELAAIASELVTLDEEPQWAAFVHHAEAAISREHTLWRASRGIR
jgi:SMODS and SLOG-associating 2TM effector domain 3/SMODS and SLOG-associating 2TM effector domain 1